MDNYYNHYFDWEDGRILHDEYQIIYITKGKGSSNP
jgi:hypothetical protein